MARGDLRDVSHFVDGVAERRIETRRAREDPSPSLVEGPCAFVALDHPQACGEQPRGAEARHAGSPERRADAPAPLRGHDVERVDLSHGAVVGWVDAAWPDRHEPGGPSVDRRDPCGHGLGCDGLAPLRRAGLHRLRRDEMVGDEPCVRLGPRLHVDAGEVRRIEGPRTPDRHDGIGGLTSVRHGTMFAPPGPSCPHSSRRIRSMHR